MTNTARRTEPMTPEQFRTEQLVLAIDPGNEKSAYVVFDGEQVLARAIVDNDTIISGLSSNRCDHLAIEGIACYGMPVGKEVFDTAIWIGRFMQAFGAERSTLIYRGEVKTHLCRSMRAKDPMIRQALIDKFGPGKERAIGKKKTPGPLFGISSHCWSALAIAVTFWETKRTLIEAICERTCSR